MNFKKIEMVKIFEFIFLHFFKSMIRSKELLHIDTPDPTTHSHTHNNNCIIINARFSRSQLERDGPTDGPTDRPTDGQSLL